MISSAAWHPHPFLFERDTFAFANELVWQYRFDPASGAMITFRRDTAPDYTHRCFVMVRAARQFIYHALFRPKLDRAEAEIYRKLIREIVSRNPRRPCTEADRLVIPGYDGLRTFSQEHEQLLKSECGSAWESYLLRSHWRMVFPVGPTHQERMAQQLVKSLEIRPLPIVHIFRFPRIAINHGLGLFGLTETDCDLQFDAYDPNIPERPLKLLYDRTTRTFSFPPTHYWAGGPVKVYEICHGYFY